MRLLLVAMLAAPTLQSELKILDTPYDGTGPEPCAVTCSGIARWDTPGDYGWKDARGSYNPGKAYMMVRTRGCNFVSSPLITVTTKSWWDGLCPAVTQITQPAWSSLFYVMTVENTAAEVMKKRKCDIVWIATGYIC